jgi:perosamine synthetase
VTSMKPGASGRPTDDSAVQTAQAAVDVNGISRRAIPLSSADLGVSERAYVVAALDAGWISGTGPQVKELERRLAERISRAHVIATANGTLAIELALRALGIGRGDEVIVPALTFAAPASSILAVGATPILADIAEDTWTLCSDDVAERITHRTRAILAVDILGHPCDYDALAQFGLPVIEDAAEAHGARYKGRPVGSFGVISAFSFHANKAITTGEGGCAATDSAELADRMRVIANHGMRPEQPYVHDVVGRNHRMTNLAAAVGLGQLDRWDELIAARNRVSAEYDRLLAGAGCAARPVAHWADYSCWLHTITVGNRSEILAYVRDRGVDARAIWPALSSQKLFNVGDGSFPVAEEIATRAIWLPTFSSMTADDIQFVARTVRQAITRAEEPQRWRTSAS